MTFIRTYDVLSGWRSWWTRHDSTTDSWSTDPDIFLKITKERAFSKKSISIDEIIIWKMTDSIDVKFESVWTYDAYRDRRFYDDTYLNKTRQGFVIVRIVRRLIERHVKQQINLFCQCQFRYRALRDPISRDKKKIASVLNSNTMKYWKKGIIQS